MVYIMVDVEADGPIPGDYCTCFAQADRLRKTFTQKEGLRQDHKPVKAELQDDDAN